MLTSKIMALVDQWKATRPWYVDSIGALAGAALGLGGGFQLLFPAAQGTMIAHRETGWDHPLRIRIIETLEKSSFHIIGDSITFLSGDLTEKIKAKTTKIVAKMAMMTFLSEILFMKKI